MSRTTSGRVRTRFSLQPSSAAPPKSSAVRLHCCSMVPMAPSSTRMRCDKRSRSALADSVRLRMGRKVDHLLADGYYRGARRLRLANTLIEVLSDQSPQRLSFILPGFSTGHEAACIERAFGGLNGN